jgi:hypothetical protein
MTTSPIEKIISDAKIELAQRVQDNIGSSKEQTSRVFELAKDAFIRLLESEAGVGHFEEFLKVYNGTATTISVAQIGSLLEHFHAKKLRNYLKISDMDAAKAARIVSLFVIERINTKKSTPTKDIKTLCAQMGLDDCIPQLEALKEKWDDLSPEEKKRYSH